MDRATKERCRTVDTGTLMQYSTPAIIVGGGLNALGIVRSLAAAGVSTWVLDTDPMAPAMRSRHGHPHWLSGLDGEPLLAGLREEKRGNHPMDNLQYRRLFGSASQMRR